VLAPASMGVLLVTHTELRHRFLQRVVCSLLRNCRASNDADESKDAWVAHLRHSPPAELVR